MKIFFSLMFAGLLFSCTANSQTKSVYKTIEYEAGPCFGFCPIYKIKIEAERTAVFDAERFNFSKGQSKDDFNKPSEGQFTTTIKAEDYKKLVSLLDSLNAKSLQNKYGSKEITDLPTSYLRISYADGSAKTIEDYGKHGTEKLEEVYQFFDELRKNQDWKKVK